LHYITRSCEEYYNLNLGSSGTGSHYNLAGYTDVPLTNTINNNDEVTTWRVLCTKWRIIGIRITFNYSRIVPSGTLLNKLIITPTTDLINITDPKYNKNSMILDMSRPGTKNFNFNLNKSNMKEDNIDWLGRADDFNGLIKLTISEQGSNINTQDTTMALGVFKIAFICRFALEDVRTGLKRVIKEKEKLDDEKEQIEKEKIELEKLTGDIAKLRLSSSSEKGHVKG